ncbi:hypothetical protein QP519_02005 [Weeksella virosa]|uniref:hypothetical protein n=1 Tax=Weeksella virosa TaxID=1014 RepID=UPI0025539DA2|nr:hypothetical protein [Weeksella virosa]MDK7374321.1 hypothetical protein [Weeksella virosa]
MNKKNLLLLTINIILFAASSLHAQVGINTDNPQQLLHVDGKKDNPTTGSPSADQQKDDVVITEEGRLGIGTIAPTESLDVDGRARIRNTDYLESSAIARLYVDENGLVGRSSRNIKAAYLGSNKKYNPGNFEDYKHNNHYYLPVTLDDVKVNTLGVTYVPESTTPEGVKKPASIQIHEDGYYMYSGSITFMGSLNNDGNGLGYIDFFINVSGYTGSGSGHQDDEGYYTIGGRRAFTRESLNSGASYSYTFPTKIAYLHAGTTFTISMFNSKIPTLFSRVNFGTSSFSTFFVDGSGIVPSYTFSIIKL